MAEIIPMTEEQKFQLEIYKLVMNQNAAAEEAFQFIGTDELKLELFKIHFQSGGANSDITTRTIEAVRKSKEALDLFTTGAINMATQGFDNPSKFRDEWDKQAEGK